MKKNRIYGLMKSIGLFKMMKIMRVTVFILIISLTQVFAENSYSQQTKLFLNMKNVKVEDVLDEIEKSSEFFFLYNKNMVNVDRIVAVNADGKLVTEVLDQLFKSTDVTYSIRDRQILLINNRMLESSVETDSKQQKGVTGKVTDESGSPLPGVSVFIKGTNNGTITDSNGIYTLSNISSEKTLVFSFVGMKSQEVKIGAKSEINVVLQNEVIGLDEVVAIGYGVVKKQDLTGSVSSIKSEALQERAITTLSEAFAGQLAGVRAQQVSGKPGAELNIVIRGNNSISTSNNPLYIIDGIPVDDIKDISPNDIASIEVLKDASSSSIYGARGAGGVVLISTKQGKKGKPTFNFDMNYGFQQNEKTVRTFNRNEFIAYNYWGYNESYRRSGGDMSVPVSSRPLAYQYPSSWLNPETLPDINWLDEITRIAPMQNFQLSASGGSDMGSFLILGSYMKQDGVVRYTNYQRANFRLNTTLNVGKHLKLGMNIAPSFSEDNNPDSEGQASVISWATLMAPIVPLNKQTEEWGYVPSVYDVPNPLEVLKEVHAETKNNKILTNVWGELTVNKSLSIKSQYGYNLREERNSYCKPLNVNDGDPTQANSYVKDWYSWSLQNTLNYSTKISDNLDINLLFGQSIEKSKYYYIYAEAEDIPIDLVYTLNVATTPLTTSTLESENSLASFFGRLKFSFKDKYLLTVNGRRDGSSRFGKDSKWGWFPSASVGWKIDRENFLKNTDWLDLLKLRVSIGKTGNNNIGNYNSIALLSQTNYNLNGTVVSGLSSSTAGNPDLCWETLISKNIGVDLNIFKNRIQANLDYYIDDTKDMLYKAPVPYISGYSSMLQNIGAIQNRGWEFELTSNNFKNEFSWVTTFNVSKNNNEVKKLGKDNTPIITNLAKFTCFITKVGKPIGNYYMYKTDGLLSDDDFDANGKALVPILAGAEKGNVKVVDMSGDKKISGSDYTIVGNNQPDFIWGMTNRFSYKGFDLSVLVLGSQGGKVFFLGARHYDSGTFTYNLYSRWARCYKADYSSIPKEMNVDMSWDGKTPNPFGNNPRYNDTWLYDASFVHLKNITLGYNFPKTLCNHIGIQHFRIYLMGENLYKWDHNYPGFSNETNSYGSNNTLNPGVDYGTYPPMRKYSLGINVTF